MLLPWFLVETLQDSRWSTAFSFGGVKSGIKAIHESYDGANLIEGDESLRVVL